MIGKLFGRKLTHYTILASLASLWAFRAAARACFGDVGAPALALAACAIGAAALAMEALGTQSGSSSGEPELSPASAPARQMRFHRTLEEREEYIPQFRWQRDRAAPGVSARAGAGAPPGAAAAEAEDSASRNRGNSSGTQSPMRPSMRRKNSGRVGPMDFGDATSPDRGRESRTTTGSSDATFATLGTSSGVFIDVMGLEDVPALSGSRLSATMAAVTAAPLADPATSSPRPRQPYAGAAAAATAATAVTFPAALDAAAAVGRGVIAMLGASLGFGVAAGADPEVDAGARAGEARLQAATVAASSTAASAVSGAVNGLGKAGPSRDDHLVGIRRRGARGGALSADSNAIASIKRQQTSSATIRGANQPHPGSVLLAAAADSAVSPLPGRKLYSGRSAERVARIKASKAQREARKLAGAGSAATDAECVAMSASPSADARRAKTGEEEEEEEGEGEGEWEGEEAGHDEGESDVGGCVTAEFSDIADTTTAVSWLTSLGLATLYADSLERHALSPALLLKLLRQQRPSLSSEARAAANARAVRGALADAGVDRVGHREVMLLSLQAVRRRV